MSVLKQFAVFDSHFHIIDTQFPLVANNGYIPDEFTCEDYLQRTAGYTLCGGAVVSGSFQAFDQTYLLDALNKLGPRFVGVTQLPATTSDDEIIHLHQAGVRAVRFNLWRGGSEKITRLASMAHRIYELAGWHVELYVDAAELNGLYNTLVNLPAVSIDHIGLSRAGLKTLTKLAEKGVRIKATGFGRVDFSVKDVLRDLYSANPESLMFGTDLPSTRAAVPYSDNDLLLVMDALPADAVENVLNRNALSFYKLPVKTT